MKIELQPEHFTAARKALQDRIGLGQFLRSLPKSLSVDELRPYSKAYVMLRASNQSGNETKEN